MLKPVRAGVFVVGLTAALTASACVRTGGGGDEEACKRAAIAAEPGRVVTADGKQHLELSGRLTYEGKGLAGAVLQFVYNHDRAGGEPLSIIAGERTTDAGGAAAFRQAFDTLTHDVRTSGALLPTYRITWDNVQPIDGVQYCSGAVGEAPLPLDQLPKP